MPVIRHLKSSLAAPSGELQAAQQQSLLPTGQLGTGPQLPQPAPLDLQLQPPGGAEGGATASAGDTPGPLQMPSFDSAEIEALMQLQRQFSPDTGLPIMLSKLSNMLQVGCRDPARRSPGSLCLPACCRTCCRSVNLVHAACRWMWFSGHLLDSPLQGCTRCCHGCPAVLACCFLQAQVDCHRSSGSELVLSFFNIEP